jgi:hypothetical protein
LRRLKLMRLTARLLCGALLAAGIPLLTSDRTVSAAAQSGDSSPQILNAQVKGKKLIVTGNNFAMGAVILVNGEPQKTKNDGDLPTTMLIAKKAGKKIPNNTAVSIQIQSNGSTSDRFGMFKGIIVTIADLGKPLLLKTGDRFLLFLEKAGYVFEPTVLDTSIVRKVDDSEIIPGSQGVFEAKAVGSTKLNATGELPCAKSIPPCMAPTLNLEFTIIVSNSNVQ